MELECYWIITSFNPIMVGRGSKNCNNNADEVPAMSGPVFVVDVSR